MYIHAYKYMIHCTHNIYRDRPAAISVNVKSIADTSNFDDFPEIERNGESHDANVMTSCDVMV